jgi:hypothetical protein
MQMDQKEVPIMRKTLMCLTAVAALAGAGLISQANAAPVATPTHIQGASVQTVQYYYGRPYWHHHHHHWRRWHHWHRRW